MFSFILQGFFLMRYWIYMETKRWMLPGCDLPGDLEGSIPPSPGLHVP